MSMMSQLVYWLYSVSKTRNCNIYYLFDWKLDCKMSVVKFTDSSLVKESVPVTDDMISVCPRVNKGNLCVNRSINTCSTPQLMGTQAILGGVAAVSQAKNGTSSRAKSSSLTSSKAKSSSLSTTATTTPVNQHSTTSVADSLDANSSKNQVPKRPKSKTTTQQLPLQLTTVPDISLVKLGTTKYHLNLPAGAPLVPPAVNNVISIAPTAAAAAAAAPTSSAVATPATAGPNHQDNKTSINYDGHQILDIYCNNKKSQLVSNPVLIFINNSLAKGEKSQAITKLLIDYFKENELKVSFDLAKSMLKKDDRPIRKSIQQNVEVKLAYGKLTSICGKLITMVKKILKISNIEFAIIEQTPVPLQYASDRLVSEKKAFRTKQ